MYRHAQGAFAARFDAEADKAVLERFLSSTANARTREDLKTAWTGIPELSSRFPDFLEKQIFAKAAADTDWPSDGTSLDEKQTFVEGTRAALKDFLRTG